MKKVVFLSVAVLTYSLSVSATESGTWWRDFEKARSEALKRNVPILINFSGSDWCFWCKKLDAEVISQNAFKTFAKENLVLLLADFPSAAKLPENEVKQNEELARRFGVEGYPTIVLISPKGELIGTTGYRRGGAEAYVKHLKSLMGKEKS